jgi:hypothetical protein
LQYLEGLVELKVDHFLDEYQARIAGELDKEVSTATLCRAMSSLKITNKRVCVISRPPISNFQLITHLLVQLDRPAEEHSIEQRNAYLEVISQYQANQLVFTDESYCDKRNTARLTGWAKKGKRATAAVPFRRGRR